MYVLRITYSLTRLPAYLCIYEYPFFIRELNTIVVCSIRIRVYVDLLVLLRTCTVVRIDTCTSAVHSTNEKHNYCILSKSINMNLSDSHSGRFRGHQSIVVDTATIEHVHCLALGLAGIET